MEPRHTQISMFRIKDIFIFFSQTRTDLFVRLRRSGSGQAQSSNKKKDRENERMNIKKLMIKQV